jgi:flavin-dependent dehydrogenase
VRVENLIVGGGPSGAAAAIRLAQAGHAPLLLERSKRPSDKVCGDFIAADAIERLQALGVAPASLGAEPIHRVRLVHGRRVADTALPFPACGLSRRVLDAALLQRAAEAGADVQLGTGVRDLTHGPAGWQLRTERGMYSARSVFLGTGKHDLRAHPRPGVRNGAVGLKMYFQLAPAQRADLSGAIELYLAPGIYAGLQNVEQGRSVLCLAVRAGYVRPWPDLLTALTAAMPQLRLRLDGADDLLPRPLAVAGVPYGFLYRPAAPAATLTHARTAGPGAVLPATASPLSPAVTDSNATIYRLGDQAAVIPSLAGDGIAIALHSGSLAASCWLSGADAAAYHRQLAADLTRQMRIAGVLHALALHPLLQRALPLCAGVAPAILQRAAAATRIRAPAKFTERLPTRGLHPA